MKRNGLSFLITALLLSLAENVLADAVHGVPAIDADTIELNEFTVTALKQGVLAKEALSSTVLSHSELERLNVMSVKDVSDVVPNFYIPDYGSRMTSSIYVRGIGARIDQPAVGMNVDNVPFMNKDAYDFDLADITRIEMLRGPQSALYGRNTIGGVINITTLSPLAYQGIRMSLEYGSANSWKASAGWYGKMSKTAGLAVVGQFNSTDGFFKNQFNGKRCDWERQWMGRLKFDWQTNDNLRLQNTFSYSHLRQGGYPYESVASGSIAYNDTCFYRRTLLNDGLTLRLDLDKVVLSSVTSAQYIDDNMTLDQDFLPLDYFTLTQARKEWAITQEIIAKSNTCSNYQWLAGLFGFYKHTRMNAPVTFNDYGISQLIESHRNEANPSYPIRWKERAFPLDSRFVMPAFGLAAYHQSTLDVDRWHFTLGLRLDFERTNMTYGSHCDTEYEILKRTGENTYIPYRDVPVKIDDRGRLHASYVELLPKFNVLYNICETDNLANVYFSVAKGYKAGGFNTQMFSDVLQQRLMSLMGIGMLYDVDDVVSYKPEKSWNYELGFHGEFLNHRLSADCSFFYIDCVDQQLTVFPDGNTTGRIMTNAGKTRSYGCELQSSLSATDRLEMRLSYGFTNAKFRKFFNGKTDYSGRYVPYVPEHTLFAGIDYTIPLKSTWTENIVLSGNLRGTGPIRWNEDNTLQQSFYATLGLSATLQAKHWSLQIWGENVTDTKYYTFYFMSIGNEFVQRARPATCGVTLRISIN